MTPLERADKVREFVAIVTVPDGRPRPDVPPGSLILTPDEAMQIRHQIAWIPPCDAKDAVLALLAGKGQT